MLQKQSLINISDNSGIKWFQIFHLYGGSFCSNINPGFYCKGSAKIVKAPRNEYKGFKFKTIKRGDIFKTLFIRGKYNSLYMDFNSIKFNFNNNIVIKSKKEPKFKHLYGPILYKFPKKKSIYLFKSII
jgi:ribosomal protein L14